MRGKPLLHSHWVIHPSSPPLRESTFNRKKERIPIGLTFYKTRLSTSTTKNAVCARTIQGQPAPSFPSRFMCPLIICTHMQFSYFVPFCSLCNWGRSFKFLAFSCMDHPPRLDLHLLEKQQREGKKKKKSTTAILSNFFEFSLFHF